MCETKPFAPSGMWMRGPRFPAASCQTSVALTSSQLKPNPAEPSWNDTLKGALCVPSNAEWTTWRCLDMSGSFTRQSCGTCSEMIATRLPSHDSTSWADAAETEAEAHVSKSAWSKKNEEVTDPQQTLLNSDQPLFLRRARMIQSRIHRQSLGNTQKYSSCLLWG